MKKILIPFIIISACFLAGRTSADEIVLNNGNVIKGRIIKKDTEQVKMEVFYGNINVKREEISSIKEVPLKENYMFLARGYESRKDEVKAREFYNLVLKIDPESQEAKKAVDRLTKEGRVLHGSKEQKEKEILKLNELALQEAGKENYPAALKYLEEAGVIDHASSLIKDNLIQTYLKYAWYLYRQGKKADSIELLNKGVKALPDSVEILILLGEFYYRNGKLKEAIGIWEKALKLDPANQHIKSRLEEADQGFKEKSPEIYYSDNLMEVKIMQDLSGEEETLLNRVIELFKSAAENLNSEIYYYPPRRINVSVYSESLIPSVISSGISYSGKEIIISLSVLEKESVGMINSRVIYVCTYFFLDSLMGKNAPLWMKEGYSLYRAQIPYSRELLESALRDKSFLRLRKIEDFLKSNSFGGQKNLVYAECQSFIAFLIDDFGSRFLYDTFKEIAQGTDYEDALNKFFAWSLYQLEEQWVEWLRGII